jgi:CMP-N-acetylneuraminic acid synthetase
MKPKITVYIAAHDYGRYLKQSVDSVLNQTLQDFELLIFDDGSTDDTQAVLQAYAGLQRVQITTQPRAGLAKTANRALAMARGSYFVRLDADDYLDENFLLVLATTLDRRADADLVYSDNFEIDEAGEVLGLFRRKNLDQEVLLLDLPSRGACTMYRTEVLRRLGGYWEDIHRQDGLGVWVRFIQEHRPCNVNLPLFYYRKHAASLTTHEKELHDARAEILEKHAAESGARPRTGLVLPVRRASDVAHGLPLWPIAGRPLVQYALQEAVGAQLGPVAVVTEDRAIAAACSTQPGVEVVMRPEHLGQPGAPLAPSLQLVMEAWRAARVPEPEALGVVFYTSPLMRAQHLRQAANTLAAYACDSVISVRENARLQYVHERGGLTPLFPRRGLKHERDVLYEECGAFVLGRRDLVLGAGGLGAKVGHVMLQELESIDIEDRSTLWLVEKLLEARADLDSLDNRRRYGGY